MKKQWFVRTKSGLSVGGPEAERRCEDFAGSVEMWGNFDPLGENWATVGPVEGSRNDPREITVCQRLVSEGDEARVESEMADLLRRSDFRFPPRLGDSSPRIDV